MCRKHDELPSDAQRDLTVQPSVGYRNHIRLSAILAATCGVIAATLPWSIAGSTPVVVVKMLDVPPHFEPSTVTIKVGDTVEWDNVGQSVHHSTDDPQMAVERVDVASPAGTAAFDSGFMRPGETFTHTFTKPGIYKYVCAAHEADGMKGEIVVKGSNG